MPKDKGAISVNEAGALGGSSTSPAKQEAARKNGKLGGRPRKAENQLSDKQRKRIVARKPKAKEKDENNEEDKN